jgi:hypothetical protein
MNPADIHAADHTLRPRGWRSTPLPWAQVTQVQATRLASLADEVGLVLQAGGQTLYVRETDPGFAELAAHLGLPAHWGADWVARAEAGEALTLSR